MKLAAAKSIVHHTQIETQKLEEFKAQAELNMQQIEELHREPKECQDTLDNAEAELSVLEETRILLQNTIKEMKQKLARPSDPRLRGAEQSKKRFASMIAATEKRLRVYTQDLAEAQNVIKSYEAKEVDRLANQIVDGALLMDQLENMTLEQRVEKLKQLRHDKRVESQKEKGKHYHRMIRSKQGDDEENVIQVPCHGKSCQFCPTKPQPATA